MPTFRICTSIRVLTDKTNPVLAQSFNFSSASYTYLDKSGGDEQPRGFRYTANKAQTAGGCAQLARSVCWQHRSELREEAQDEDTRATCAVSNRGASHAIVLILSGNVPMEVRHDLSDITGY